MDAALRFAADRRASRDAHGGSLNDGLRASKIVFGVTTHVRRREKSGCRPHRCSGKSWTAAKTRHPARQAATDAKASQRCRRTLDATFVVRCLWPSDALSSAPAIAASCVKGGPRRNVGACPWFESIIGGMIIRTRPLMSCPGHRWFR